MTALFTLLLAAAAAADPGRPPDSYFKEQDYYVGTWRGEGKIGDDPYQSRLTVERLPGQTTYLLRGTFRLKGGPEQHFTILSGWDPASRRIVDTEHDSDGTFTRLVWNTTTPDLSGGDLAGTDGQGRKVAAKVRIEKKQDSYRWRTLDPRVNGQPGPVTDITLTRQPAAPRPGDLTPEDFVRYYSPLHGTHTTTAEAGGKTLPGRTTWRPAANGTCLLVSSEAEGSPSAQSVQGYDVRTGTYRLAWFDGRGNFTEGTLDHVALKPGQVLGVGPLGIWKDVIVRDGKLIQRTADVACTRLDDKQVVLVWSNIKEDGQPVPNETWTVNRQPAPAPVPGKPRSAAPANPAPAAAVSPAYEKMKVLDPLVGSWRMTAEVNGQPFICDIENRWLPGKSGLSWVVWERPRSGGPRQEFASGMIVYDGQAGAVKEYAAFATGETRVGVMKPLGGNRVAWTCTVAGVDGTTATESFEETLTPDRVAFTDSERKTRDGKVLQRVRNTVMTRVAPDPGAAPGQPRQGASTRQDFEEFCRVSQGRWVGDITLIADWPGIGKKGDKITSHRLVTLVADGQAVEGLEMMGDASSKFIAFYDAAARKIRVVLAGSGGTIYQGVLHKSGGAWTVTFTGSNPDGTPIEGENTLTIGDNGNTQTWTGISTVGGQKTAPLRDVYRRVGSK